MNNKQRRAESSRIRNKVKEEEPLKNPNFISGKPFF